MIERKRKNETMKKRNVFEEFLRQLEEAIDDIVDEIEIPENRRVNIDISINLFPPVILKSGAFIQQTEKSPVDILETEKSIHTIVGLPGMEMEDIKLTCSGKVLEITARNAETIVVESIELPARVNKSSMKTTYKNGILEVIFNKAN